MNPFARFATGLIAGLIVTSILVVSVEMLSALAHPFPEGFQGTPEELSRHVERYPGWVLAAAAAAWSLTALAGTWIAGRVGNRLAAGVLGGLLVAAVIFNLAMLPYPAWFKIACLIGIPMAGWFGYTASCRAAAAGRGEEPGTATPAPGGNSVKS